VPIVYSDAQAAFGPTTIVAEYIPSGRGGPRIVLYTNGVTRAAVQQGLPPSVIAQRAVAHELLHHAAASVPPDAKRVRRPMV